MAEGARLAPDPVWCVAANVRESRPSGPAGLIVRRGTRHFAPGGKVYCFPALWGDGYERVRVVGRHRRTHRYITAVVPSEILTRWRARLVYSPEVISRLAPHWDGSPQSREKAEKLARWMERGEWQEPARPWYRRIIRLHRRLAGR